jgi:hypothetical protein
MAGQATAESATPKCQTSRRLSIGRGLRTCVQAPFAIVLYAIRWVYQISLELTCDHAKLERISETSPRFCARCNAHEHFGGTWEDTKDFLRCIPLALMFIPMLIVMIVCRCSERPDPKRDPH